jgi:hypothetical protein
MSDSKKKEVKVTKPPLVKQDVFFQRWPFDKDLRGVAPLPYDENGEPGPRQNPHEPYYMETFDHLFEDKNER